MSGIDLVCNIAKGRTAAYADLAGNEVLGLLILQEAALGTDDQLRDADSVAAVLAVATECAATGYARQTLTTVTVTVDDTNDRVDIDMDDVVLGAVGDAGTPETQAKAIIFWDPDSTLGTADSGLIPLGAYSYDVVFDGSEISIAMPTNGPLFAE